MCLVKLVPHKIWPNFNIQNPLARVHSTLNFFFSSLVVSHFTGNSIENWLCWWALNIFHVVDFCAHFAPRFMFKKSCARLHYFGATYFRVQSSRFNEPRSRDRKISRKNCWRIHFKFNFCKCSNAYASKAPAERNSPKYRKKRKWNFIVSKVNSKRRRKKKKKKI